VSQDTGEAVIQEPLPSQVGAGTAAIDIEAEVPPMSPETAGAQLVLPQTVPAAANWQPPAPLHLPVLPQVAPAAQVVLSLGVPLAAMLLQVPTFEVSTQLWQPPVQAALQHTPSALQMLLVQSLFALQPCPFASLLPH